MRSLLSLDFNNGLLGRRVVNLREELDAELSRLPDVEASKEW